MSVRSSPLILVLAEWFIDDSSLVDQSGPGRISDHYFYEWCLYAHPSFRKHYCILFTLSRILGQNYIPIQVDHFSKKKVKVQKSFEKWVRKFSKQNVIFKISKL